MVQTTLLQKDRPDPVLLDSRGTEIKQGVKIAYNMSGNICLGTVRGMTSDWTQIRPGPDDLKWWNCKFTMVVLNENGETSTLKNPNSFVILP